MFYQLCILPPDPLEAGGRSAEPAALHVGGNLQAASLSPGEGPSFLPLPQLYRYGMGSIELRYRYVQYRYVTVRSIPSSSQLRNR